MSDPLTAAEIKYYSELHFEEIQCRKCHEWTQRGEPCCGSPLCDDECPFCKEDE